jgi:uncharacterized Ntn-hydrolase superfamily protein
VTYSIVARDAATGELGVAVQSRAFRTGGAVPWALPGVGAVATQATTRKAYGPSLLERLERGARPDESLAELLADDRDAAHRQVAVIDAQGRTASHTGSAVVPAAGAQAGDGFSAQGNMLASEEVVQALAAGFAQAAGSLARRLLVALEAAQEAGGDFRGQEAGAILVVSGDQTAERWDRVSDLRVDSHPRPLAELRRLLDIEEALRALRRSSLEDVDAELERARAAGVDDDVARWIAASILADRDPAHATQLVAPLAARDPRWTEALARATQPRP